MGRGGKEEGIDDFVFTDSSLYDCAVKLGLYICWFQGNRRGVH